MRLFAEHALLHTGWAPNVTLSIDADGTITHIGTHSVSHGIERAAGPLVAGMPNVHSHAFQRAIAGRTGRPNPESNRGDSFWTWRAAMYAFLDRVDADAFEAITAQAYVEMLKAGYTSVAEFHYVHHDQRGWAYSDPAELARRVVAVAQRTGIALTLLPVFYAHAGFGGLPPTAGQRRFVHTLDSYARLVETLGADASARGYTLGVAAHSLRAVTPDELASVIALAPQNGPIHIHAAEQAQEVADCTAALQARPIEWLLENAGIDDQWCIIHATHMTPGEIRRVAKSGAAVGLAPTTEADLGDGTFAARTYIDHGGMFGVGSDSNTQIDPYAELRQLECSQRLSRLERNVLARSELPVGHFLYALAAAGGARALAQPVGAIARGRRADLVVLDDNDPALAAQQVTDVLDTAVFGPSRRPVRDVMVAGRWVVRDGHHVDEQQVLANYRTAMGRLASM
jgi:formimidoylglutamate deiminase